MDQFLALVSITTPYPSVREYKSFQLGYFMFLGNVMSHNYERFHVFGIQYDPYRMGAAVKGRELCNIDRLLVRDSDSELLNQVSEN